MKKYTLKHQVNNRGHYVEICYELNYNEHESNYLQLQYSADPKWELACTMGVRLFEGYFFRVMSGHVDLTIVDIGWMQVDTNDLIVLFGTVQALVQAFDLELYDLDIDLTGPVFRFPDPRSIV